ncbi:unnamed protein product [Blepharisma stoltei]|uniref:4-alpha-glucanotransferase n=1 Tax=Blepharisma stoltei TaxID=1481888 RepID=A0AAU9J0L2_9CILI|nr:unnamed protein product [Blepharisma stoltei]
MVKRVICRLDGYDGSFPKPQKLNFIYQIELGTTVSFQIEAGSAINTENTALVLDISQGLDPEMQRFQGSLSPLGHWICEVTFSTPGNYNIFIEYTHTNSEDQIKGSVNNLIVSPELRIGGKLLPFNGICMQTVLCLSLGPVSRWVEVFQHQRGIGYNLFHLTPIQELGQSQNLYSINDPNKLNPELFPGPESEESKIYALQNILAQLEGEGIGCIQDIVLSHVAEGSDFLEEYPNATYNLINSPYLAAAYELDKALKEFSISLWKRRVKSYGNKNRIENDRDLSNIMRILKTELLPSLRLQEFFQISVEKAYQDFSICETAEILDAGLAEELQSKGADYFLRKYAVTGEGEGRFSAKINGQVIWKVLNSLKTTRNLAFPEARKLINGANIYLLGRYERHLAEIISNLESEIRYQKIEKNNVEITSENPLVKPYFCHLRNGNYVLFDGFIIGNNEILKDYAGIEGWHYFRRNVVIWTDCVKLRYGRNRNDCPELWERMEKYVTSVAKIFKGIYLDNVHSTPLHVSEYFIAKARMANPNLFVIAELHSSDQNKEALFAKRIGINCIVREAMVANSTKSLGKMIYEYGNGEISALGSLEKSDLNSSSLLGINPEPGDIKLSATPIPIIFYDCSHKIEAPAQTRTAQDALPNAALVAMCNCAISSTRGYDELVPCQLSTNFERRLYKLPTSTERKVTEIKVFDEDFPELVKVWVEYHAEEPAREVYIKGEWDSWAEHTYLERVGDNRWGIILLFPKSYTGREFNYKYVADGVWKYDPKYRYTGTGEFINNLLSVNSRAKGPGNSENLYPAKKYLNFLHTHLVEAGYSEIFVNSCAEDVIIVVRQNPTNLDSYVLVARTAHYLSLDPVAVSGVKLPGILHRTDFIATLTVKKAPFEEHPELINGLIGNLEFTTNLAQYCNVYRDNNLNIDVLNFFRIPPAFIAVFKTKFNAGSLESIEQGYDCMSSFYSCREMLEGLNLQQINHVLWRCSQEELEMSGKKRDLYAVPGYKDFNYAGLGGLAAEFLKIIEENKLGHEICNNLKQGDWLIDYSVARLQAYELPERFKQFICDHFNRIKNLPREIVPKHFSKSVLLLFRNIKLYILRELFKESKLFHISDDSLADILGFAVLQFWGNVPRSISSESICAGLPYNSIGAMRCSGRIAFISLRGLLLCTGMWQEAREIILTYASLMQNGLIPNIIDPNNNHRYNARDTTWFFLQALQDYIKMSPEGCEILHENIKLRFKNGEIDFSNSPPIQLAQLVQLIFQSHAAGIEFKEKNAGARIDPNMKIEGFNIKIRLDPHTGFILGGNKWNRGTWMDKIGSSSKAGNKGTPATPRDGAAIEIIGLLYSSLDFFSKLHMEGKFPFEGVILPDRTNLSYIEWKAKIERYFETHFYIPEDGSSPIAVRKYIGIPGIYKDTFRSSIDYADYQLRPNQCIAMVVASKLFTPECAVIALNQVSKYLMPNAGQLGIRTLNEEDKHYKPFYDSSNDSNDGSIAQGFSCHNGPEWVWPAGYFLRALLLHNASSPSFVMKCLSEHRKFIENSSWMSMCELTDRDGKENKFSNMAYALSVATLIEVLYDLC